MTVEAGSAACRGLIEAKSSLIQAMNSLDGVRDTYKIQEGLKELYNQLEIIHDSRRLEESKQK